MTASERIRAARQGHIGTVCTLSEVPVGYAFSHKWDGEVNGERWYSPRKSYLRLRDGRVQEMGEFGRTWALSDCGFTEESLVRIDARIH